MLRKGCPKGQRQGHIPEHWQWLLLLLVLHNAFPAAGERNGAGISSKLSQKITLATEASFGSTREAMRHAAVSCSNATQALASRVVGGGGVMKDMGKLLVLCACCAIAFKMLQKAGCGGKKTDCRRCKWCGKTLLAIGYDDFEKFECFVTVHGVQDIAHEGTFGGEKEFKVVVSFFWSKFETAPTKDMKWEQTKKMEVPQGAHECVIQLFELGIMKNTCLATYRIETLTGMLEKEEQDQFWGEKQKLKLVSKGKVIGTLVLTFKLKGGDDGVAFPIAGMDESSALAMEVVKEYEEMCKEPGYKKLEKGQHLHGDEKLKLLGNVLTGELKDFGDKGTKDNGTVHVKVLQCNKAQLQGKAMNFEQLKAKAAQKRDPKLLELKWYWCCYDSKKKAESYPDEKGWNDPDFFFPMQAISKINRSPERNDQFLITYKEDGDKHVIFYRREGGKGTDVWVDGIDYTFNAVRDEVKGAIEKEKKIEKALPKMRKLHDQNFKNGPKGIPKNEEDWEAWRTFFSENNYDQDCIATFEMELKMPPKKGKK